MEAARPAVADDLAALVALGRAAIAELGTQRGGPLWRASSARREPLETGFEAELSGDPGAGCLVVGTVDDGVVGYGASHIETLADGTCLAVVTDLYVHPEARGIGVGEAMMDLLVSHAREAGAVGVDSVALPGDRATKNFFETFGLKARAITVHRSFVDDADA